MGMCEGLMVRKCEGVEIRIIGTGAGRPSASAPRAPRSLDAHDKRSRNRRCAQGAARPPRLASFDFWRGGRSGGGRSGGGRSRRCTHHDEIDGLAYAGVVADIPVVRAVDFHG